MHIAYAAIDVFVILSHDSWTLAKAFTHSSFLHANFIFTGYLILQVDKGLAKSTLKNT